MMKRNILAVIVPALLVAGTANAAEIYNKDGNKVDLYGKAVGLHYFSKGNGENSYGGNGDMTYARLGFKGETQINSDLTGYGQWEYNFQGNNSEGADAQTGNKTRLAFAGLKYADVGSFDYGRNYGVVYDALGYTDMLPEFGGDTAYSDDFFVGRVGGVATYRNSNFFGLVDGLDFAVQYQGKNGSAHGEGMTTNGRDDVFEQNGDGVGGSITYNYEGFGIGAAVSSSKRTWDQNNTGLIGTGDRAETYTGGLKYDANNIYLAAQYTQTYNATRVGSLGWANKAQNFEAVAQYQFDFGLRPSVAYLQSKGKNLGTIGTRNYDDEDILKYVDVGATYYFNKNMSTYVDYKINLLDDNRFTRDAGINTDDIVALGLVYQF